MLPPCTPVEAQRAGAIGHEQQTSTRNGQILEEHDHLCLIGEVTMKKDSGQQTESRQEEGDDAGLPTKKIATGPRSSPKGGDPGANGAPVS